MGKFYCFIFPTTATSLFVILAKANLFSLMEEQPPDNRALQNPIPYWTMHKTCSILSLYLGKIPFKFSPDLDYKPGETGESRLEGRTISPLQIFQFTKLNLLEREIGDPSLIGSKICFSDTNIYNSVKRGPDKALRAKRLFILQLSKKKLFTQVMVNRNSYEPQWCQRPEELQNKLVEGFCSAGARGRSRRDQPSSHTTAGHQTAERGKHKQHLVNSPPGVVRELKKPHSDFLIHKFPANKAV